MVIAATEPQGIHHLEYRAWRLPPHTSTHAMHPLPIHVVNLKANTAGGYTMAGMGAYAVPASPPSPRRPRAPLEEEGEWQRVREAVRDAGEELARVERDIRALEARKGKGARDSAEAC